ncbi:MAG: biotin--[acetyl-CoA-carboxylase] ligase [Lactococcus chungangensis]|jgi:BirA family biotin operon repressor/biotin-[acetyl-CoA-carboxylase] ligase|uniref:biotin--[biotin carboxyl-carrier protein] ligase n=3 Tax=Pseudolactococcus chungangensis TaxID=451457 RepID=A0ABX4IAK3_9LACT|nr:biotin--[acetyl-CoA-carboxylase] ligase [Lactococcus chungangensis]MDD3015248.1 biotin--[acetyl-CoA-carboxylase] ligase [Lactococcus chungangensis]NCB81898.1 biotin--[acetyl-CoA-carboxylase] ligase [Bacilli bacterium]NLH34811.1 biotin--[acetyl-CoA-carboxylase] ligase [Lactococcus chungangensis]PCS04889.1 Biotin-protein ligase / Biotin operon repressor [Lactococcus chungangensis CAU 28 = DSM 22330]
MIKREMILAQNPWLTDVSVVAETTSTQIDAKNDLVDKKLFIADMQTQTRGRFGRQYFASNGDGIYMSLVLKISEDVKDYTILTAAAVLTAIENLTTKKPLVKWVNDIYLDNKKICGILVEHLLSSNSIIIGVGLNFNIESFPIALREKAGSLFTNETPTITRDILIAEIWSQFHQLSSSQDFFNIYKSHSFILGKTVEFEENGHTIIGTATDLTETGELIVNSDGLVKVLSSGEISLKKWL